MRAAALISALCGAALALAGCTSEQWDPMEDQPKPLAYEPSALFTDGRSMRPIPDGAVAQESPRGPLVHLQDRPDGGAIFLAARPPLSQAALDLGRRRFEITCAACHGLTGDGRSAVATKMSLRPPADLLDPPVAALTDTQLYAVITLGYGMMPALRGWFPARERWAVIDYLRALQLAHRAPRAALAPEDLRALARRGGP